MPNNQENVIEYVAHPMRESILKASLFWMVVLFTIWGVWLNIGSLIFTVIASLILIGSLNSFYLPTIYRIDATGASWSRFTGSRSIEWSRVRRISDEREGLFLSPFATRSMMENFRGLYLPYRANREEILALVRRFAPTTAGGNPLPGEQSGDTTPKLPNHNYFGHQRK